RDAGRGPRARRAARRGRPRVRRGDVHLAADRRDLPRPLRRGAHAEPPRAAPILSLMAGRRGGSGPDWGNIDWSNFDLGALRGGRGGRAISGPPVRRSVAITVVVILVLLLPLVLGPLISFLTDLLWFRSLGLEDVFLRRYTAAFWAFVAFF